MSQLEFVKLFFGVSNLYRPNLVHKVEQTCDIVGRNHLVIKERMCGKGLLHYLWSLATKCWSSWDLGLYVFVSAEVCTQADRYLGHALVLIHRHKLVTHAVDQQDGHRELSVVHLIPLGPVLTAHHGSQDERRHVEGVALLQQLLLFGSLASKSSPESQRRERGGT